MQQGKYFTGQRVKLTGVAQVTRAVVVAGGTQCIPQIADVTDTKWELIAKPGNGPTITTIDRFTASVEPVARR